MAGLCFSSALSRLRSPAEPLLLGQRRHTELQEEKRHHLSRHICRSAAGSCCSGEAEGCQTGRLDWAPEGWDLLLERRTWTRPERPASREAVALLGKLQSFGPSGIHLSTVQGTLVSLVLYCQWLQFSLATLGLCDPLQTHVEKQFPLAPFTLRHPRVQHTQPCFPGSTFKSQKQQKETQSKQPTKSWKKSQSKELSRMKHLNGLFAEGPRRAPLEASRGCEDRAGGRLGGPWMAGQRREALASPSFSRKTWGGHSPLGGRGWPCPGASLFGGLGGAGGAGQAGLNWVSLPLVQPQPLVDELLSHKLSEDQIELKEKQLSTMRVDVCSTETLKCLKDKTGGKKFSKEFEEASAKLEEFVHSLDKQVKNGPSLTEVLENAGIFYEAQYKEVKVVANDLPLLSSGLVEERKEKPAPSTPAPTKMPESTPKASPQMAATPAAAAASGAPPVAAPMLVPAPITPPASKPASQTPLPSSPALPLPNLANVDLAKISSILSSLTSVMKNTGVSPASRPSPSTPTSPSSLMGVLKTPATGPLVASPNPLASILSKVEITPESILSALSKSQAQAAPGLQGLSSFLQSVAGNPGQPSEMAPQSTSPAPANTPAAPGKGRNALSTTQPFLPQSLSYSPNSSSAGEVSSTSVNKVPSGQGPGLSGLSGSGFKPPINSLGFASCQAPSPSLRPVEAPTPQSSEILEAKMEPEPTSPSLEMKIHNFLKGNPGFSGLNLNIPILSSLGSSSLPPESHSSSSPDFNRGPTSTSMDSIDGTPVRDERSGTPTQDEMMDKPSSSNVDTMSLLSKIISPGSSTPSSTRSPLQSRDDSYPQELPNSAYRPFAAEHGGLHQGTMKEHFSLPPGAPRDPGAQPPCDHSGQPLGRAREGLGIAALARDALGSSLSVGSSVPAQRNGTNRVLRHVSIAEDQNSLMDSMAFAWSGDRRLEDGRSQALLCLSLGKSFGHLRPGPQECHCSAPFCRESPVVPQAGMGSAALPSQVAERLALYRRLKAAADERQAEQSLRGKRPILVSLPDGQSVECESWTTTPYRLALQISQSLAETVVTARVNGGLYDLDRPLEGDATVEFLGFDSQAGQELFWHSSAHLLGEAAERFYGALLCHGPSTEQGFFYDLYLDEERKVSSKDLPELEELCKATVAAQIPFERLEVSREDLLELFKHNRFKLDIIRRRVKSRTATVYRCGTLVDLCQGPHLRHSGEIRALKLLKVCAPRRKYPSGSATRAGQMNSATSWQGDPSGESLQRIYGISFPSAQQLAAWECAQEEAAQRDHRRIGMVGVRAAVLMPKDQELFFFHPLSPGSCFFLPKGTHIYTTLMDFIKVWGPGALGLAGSGVCYSRTRRGRRSNRPVYLQSEYLKRGFSEVITPNIFNAKLWETSGHWEHYGENMFSFPVEGQTFALKPMNCPGHCLMFGHRPRSWRELPLRLADFGVLHRNESSGSLTGLTRVRRFQQDDAHIFCTMDQLQGEIRGCLDFLQAVYSVFGFTFRFFLSTRPEHFLGDPPLWDQAEQVDIQIQDALGRYHQCATIQLDFQMPLRFNLSYKGSPSPALVSPLQQGRGGSREAGHDPPGSAGLRGEDAGCLGRELRGQMVMVGRKEVTHRTVNVRSRDNHRHGERDLQQVQLRLRELQETRVRNAEEIF
ncbi:Threonyl-tRNA synthetase, cytoplasmic [Ophiophagus hannah]|uniref:threonine--tRNA ligase n=1 Tax=Ophiophagus hannah TaxID=8665 RepID=V8NLT5_OPHHA|nr:Threonyl-tRNA synthetase, cytoplasmic [Ophiophagus hannah]